MPKIFQVAKNHRNRILHVEGSAESNSMDTAWGNQKCGRMSDLSRHTALILSSPPGIAGTQHSVN